jgi:RNA polymerase sigma-70 factor (ECF subfamily)
MRGFILTAEWLAILAGEESGEAKDRAALSAASGELSAVSDSETSSGRGAPNKPGRRASNSKKARARQGDDRKLVEKVRAGDADAYAELVRRYETRIIALLLGMVRNREDARDLAQQAFIKAYRNLDRFRGSSSFYTWLYRIAFNLAIDFKRRKKNRPASEYDDGRSTSEASDLVFGRPGDENPHRDLARSRLRAVLEDAIAQLPKDQRAVVVLREVEGLSYKEIADVLDCPEGTVMSRLFYARKKLQDILRDVKEEQP